MEASPVIVGVPGTWAMGADLTTASSAASGGGGPPPSVVAMATAARRMKSFIAAELSDGVPEE